MIERSALTVETFFRRWLNDVVRGTVSDDTLERYQRIVRRQIAPAIGHIPIARLRPRDVDGVFQSMEGQAERSKRCVHAVLRRGLKYAADEEFIAINPAGMTGPPKIDRANVITLTSGEVRKFLEVAERHPLYALYALALATGMTRGELFALKWSDVAEAAIYVRRAVVHDGDSFVEKQLKSPRIVPLARFAVDALEQHRRHSGPSRTSPWVFCNDDGERRCPAGVSEAGLHSALREVGLPKIGLSDLRHTCAVLLLKGGVHPKAVQEMLGILKLTTVLNRYAHALPGRPEVVEVLDELFMESFAGGSQ